MKMRDYVKYFCFSLHPGQGKQEAEWEKRGTAWGDTRFSRKHPDLEPWDDTRLGAFKPESYLIQSTGFTACLDRRCSEVPQSPLARTKLMLAEVQTPTQRTSSGEGDTPEQKRKPSPMGAKQRQASTPVPSCRLGELLRLRPHARSSPSPIHDGYHRSFIRGDSIERATAGRQVCPPSIPHLRAGGTGGTCPVGRGRIITGKWQLSFCLTCFGRNSWGYYRN